METVNQTMTSHYTREATMSSTWWDKQAESAEFNRFGIISMGFVLIGIIGGIAIGISAFAHIWQIAVISVFTMLSLYLMLAVAPMKYILSATALALAVDVLIVLLNTII
jgi:predicted lipid-binding transport protein (Tim44 family)